jgi:hypothetical protein
MVNLLLNKAGKQVRTPVNLSACESDLDLVERRPDRASAVETVFIGTFIGDALIGALRRAAQEHVSNTRYRVGSVAPVVRPGGD